MRGRSQRNTDNDDDGRAAQGDAGELLRLRARTDDQRRDRDDAQVDRAEECDLVEHLLDEFARRLACAEAGMNPPFFFRLFATSIGLNWIVE